MSDSIQTGGDGSKYTAIMSQIIAKCWKDADYKAKLMAQPEAVIAEEGITVPAGTKFKVLEATPSVRYLPISRHIDHTKDGVLTQIIGKILPIPEGVEIRLVQSTETLRYIVLPMPPDSVNVQASSVADLSRLAAPASSVANVTQAVNVQTGVNVSTVVSAGEVVAVAVVAGAVVVT